MKDKPEYSENFKGVVGFSLSMLAIFLFVWFMRSLPPAKLDNSLTPDEAAQYERYKTDQQLNANAENEACMDRMARDVERYGERVADSYNCTN